MTQGDPLDMVAYGIGIIPLIKHLKLTYTDVRQTWYVDDDGALVTFYKPEPYFKALNHKSPARGYYPETTTIILCVHPQNPKSGELFGQRH